MLLLKTCPRCHGDLQIKNDVNGRYLSCFQCGYMRDLPNKPARFDKKEEVLDKGAR